MLAADEVIFFSSSCCHVDRSLMFLKCRCSFGVELMRLIKDSEITSAFTPQISTDLSSQLSNKSRETNIPECPQRRSRLEAGVTCVGGHLKAESRSDTLADGLHNQSYIIQKNNTLLLCPPTPPPSSLSPVSSPGGPTVVSLFQSSIELRRVA